MYTVIAITCACVCVCVQPVHDGPAVLRAGATVGGIQVPASAVGVGGRSRVHPVPTTEVGVGGEGCQMSVVACERELI